jgi:hypothetical protein
MSNTTSINYSIVAVRRISPLRQWMIADMTVRNFAPNTMLAYLKQVTRVGKKVSDPMALEPQ